MNKFKLFGIVLFLAALVVGGCGNKSNDEPHMTNEKISDSIENGDGYGFTEFDLEIDVDGKDAIDIDYDVDGVPEAEYKNELTNVFVDGTEAMDEASKLFVNILITKDTPKDVVIEKVNNYLRIDNYSKFELDVKFGDGTILEIKD